MGAKRPVSPYWAGGDFKTLGQRWCVCRGTSGVEGTEWDET